MIKRTLVLVGVSAFHLVADASLYLRANGMIYDDVLDITWLQDANYAYTSGYAAANATGDVDSGADNIQADGRMGWDAANAWVDQLVYGGHDDWRLASANLVDPNNPPCFYINDSTCDGGYNKTNSELGHMFYDDLGNVGYYDTNGETVFTGWGLSNTSFVDGGSGDMISIMNLQSSSYWLAEEYNDPTFPWAEVWAFNTDLGSQSGSPKSHSHYAWAVRSGDVGTMPLPSAGWLFGGALLALAGKQYRNR